jgi:hypothetical protein
MVVVDLAIRQEIVGLPRDGVSQTVYVFGRVNRHEGMVAFARPIQAVRGLRFSPDDHRSILL